MYQLADDYVCNNVNEKFYQYRSRSLAFQSHCYRALREVILTYECKSVLDFGCGHWIKLYKYIYPVCKDIVGIDLPEHIDRNGSAPFGMFIGHDLEKDVFQSDRKFDIIVASDIVEHLVNPDNLMNSVKNNLAEDCFVLFATPDRSFQRIGSEKGPYNQFHVREWTEDEFCAYLKSSGFELLRVFRSLRQSNIYFCGMKGS